MENYICNAFVRNDGNPSRAMQATLISSLFNIVMDYVLMFPLGLGMAGAALATAFSPVVGILICCTHFFSKKCTVRFVWQRPSLRRLKEACQLGTSAFIGKLSSGVTTAVFNFLILDLVYCGCLWGRPLSWLLGMTGIWLAFPAAELLTLFVMAVAVRKTDFI